jgi:hypothetical protein
MYRKVFGETPFEFLDEKTEVIEAVESSNIIWENLSITGLQLFKNWLKISGCIALFLLTILSLLSWLKHYIISTYTYNTI